MGWCEITVAGIVVPCDAPFFLAVVGLHVSIALVCIVSGAIAMLSEKRAGRHPKAGTVYHWFLTAVFIFATTYP